MLLQAPWCVDLQFSFLFSFIYFFSLFAFLFWLGPQNYFQLGVSVFGGRHCLFLALRRSSSIFRRVERDTQNGSLVPSGIPGSWIPIGQRPWGLKRVHRVSVEVRYWSWYHEVPRHVVRVRRGPFVQPCEVLGVLRDWLLVLLA